MRTAPTRTRHLPRKRGRGRGDVARGGRPGPNMKDSLDYVGRGGATNVSRTGRIEEGPLGAYSQRERGSGPRRRGRGQLAALRGRVSLGDHWRGNARGTPRARRNGATENVD